MFKIKRNPKWDYEQHKEFDEKVAKNDGHCPCMLLKNDDTKCMCKEFREMNTAGECHCSRYIKY